MPNPTRDNLSSILGNPCLFPHALDERSGEMVFVSTNRDKLSKASFLDGREPFYSGPGNKRNPLKDLIPFLEKSPSQKNNLNFIFHTGFCCSTLLARCLDQPGTCLALKEPKILNSFSHSSGFARSENERLAHGKKLELSLSLLSRQFSENEKVIIKPSNIDTVLLDQILSINPASKMVFNYSDLKSFLISIAKGGQPRRDFVRRHLAHFLADFKTRQNYTSDFFGIQENLIWNLSDLHIAAGAWHLQMKYLDEAIGRNIYWLNCEEFLAEPVMVLEKLKNFFGLIDTKQNQAFGKLQMVLAQHAKAPSFSYNAAKRKTDFIALNDYLSPVLPEVLSWAEGISSRGEKNQQRKIAV